MAANKETKLTLAVPRDFTADMREELAAGVISLIVDRTRHGYAPNGSDWPGKAGKYSKAYAKEKGVSEDGPVDLSLSFDMLDAIQFFRSQSGPGKITIGFRAGTKVERRAEGNILGTYGRPDPIPGKARPFLDISQSDYRSLIEEVRFNAD